jgi:hypothetical protein
MLFIASSLCKKAIHLPSRSIEMESGLPAISCGAPEPIAASFSRNRREVFHLSVINETALRHDTS